MEILYRTKLKDHVMTALLQSTTEVSAEILAELAIEEGRVTEAVRSGGNLTIRGLIEEEAWSLLDSAGRRSTRTAAEILIVTTTSRPDLLDQAFALRHRVFLEEVGRDRTVETDEYDETAQHVVGVLAGRVIGTLRLYTLTPGDRDIKIGRVAVDRNLRGRGIGRDLMWVAGEWATAQGFVSAYLHAEATAIDFYKTLGYRAEGEQFMESGKPHLAMRLNF